MSSNRLMYDKCETAKKVIENWFGRIRYLFLSWTYARSCNFL